MPIASVPIQAVSFLSQSKQFPSSANPNCFLHRPVQTVSFLSQSKPFPSSANPNRFLPQPIQTVSFLSQSKQLTSSATPNRFLPQSIQTASFLSQSKPLPSSANTNRFLPQPIQTVNDTNGFMRFDICLINVILLLYFSTGFSVWDGKLNWTNEDEGADANPLLISVINNCVKIFHLKYNCHKHVRVKLQKMSSR